MGFKGIGGRVFQSKNLGGGDKSAKIAGNRTKTKEFRKIAENCTKTKEFWAFCGGGDFGLCGGILGFFQLVGLQKR